MTVYNTKTGEIVFRNNRSVTLNDRVKTMLVGKTDEQIYFVLKDIFGSKIDSFDCFIVLRD